MKNLQKYTFFCLIAALFTLAACDKEPIGMGELPNMAKVIFINAAPNGSTSPAVARRDIAIYTYFNNVNFYNSPVRFPWSTGYKAFDPGNMAIRLDSALSQGNTPPGPAGKIADFNFPTQAGKYYSIYGIGTIQKIEYAILEDDITPSADPKMAKVRFMNYSPDSGPIDIVANGKVVASNLKYKDLQAFTDMAPGVYSMQIVESGTSKVLNSRTGVFIDPKSVYSIWARGWRTFPSPGNTVSAHGLGISYHANRWKDPQLP